MNFFHPTNLLGRVILSLFYGLCVYVILLIIAALLKLVPGLEPVSSIINRFAYILALLAALASFVTGSRPL